MGIDRFSATQILNLRLDEFYDLAVIFELLDVALDLINGFSLRDHEALTLAHLRIDSIETQIEALLLSFDERDVGSENVDILGLVDLDVVLAACVEEKQKRRSILFAIRFSCFIMLIISVTSI